MKVKPFLLYEDHWLAALGAAVANPVRSLKVE